MSPTCQPFNPKGSSIILLSIVQVINIICISEISLINTFAALTDTLTPPQRLEDGQTLSSPNQRFELGFFSPPGTKGIRYLGIWYKDIAVFTVVWVANRNQPLKKLNATLILDPIDGLWLQDGAHNLVRISPMPLNVTPVLQILDSGNLAVKNVNNDGLIWQSFDFPCDTLLPGMKIGWNYRTGRRLVMTPWKNYSDPLTGDFTLGLDSVELPQLVLETNSVIQSRWGPWVGGGFSGTIVPGKNQLFTSSLMTNFDGIYFTFNLLEGSESALVRLVVNQLGRVEFEKWENSASQWITIVSLTRDFCDWYGVCGPNGICSIDGPTCQCLRGFGANSSAECGMDSMDCGDGCKRNFELNCPDHGDGFVMYEGLKLPDNGTVWLNLSSIKCGEKCLKECNCMAYTYTDVYGNGSVCVVWFNELSDMRSFAHGGDVLYIRMARRELELIASDKRGKVHFLYDIILVSIFSGMFVVAFVVFYLWSNLKCVKRQALEVSNSTTFSNGSQVESLEFKLFDRRIISAATNNFSSNNKIGQGGFGLVYKGELPTGQEIAVKRLSKSSQQGLQEFENESSLIARLQHRNLVKLLGCCVDIDERMLIYEYLQNKSLDRFIFDSPEARKRLLPWPKCFDIILGIAKGLTYLHEESGLTIVHRDMKASNILLDEDMTPKISDFGLARIMERNNQPQEMTMNVMGTYGYMSPEYAMHGQFSTKSDVFSFGILVLEIISGQKNWRFRHPDNNLNLLGYAWMLRREGKALELKGSVLEDSFYDTKILRCIHLGLLCAQDHPSERPTMSTVVYLLGNESIELPEPIEPGLFAGSSSFWFGSSSKQQLITSTNGLTVTTLSAR